MKFLVWSDHQCHEWSEFARILPNGLNSRLADQLTVFDFLDNTLAEDEAQIVVHDGDLIESMSDKVDKTVFLHVFERIKRLAEKHLVFLNVGNHDWIDKSETEHILKPFKEIENVIVVSEPTVFPLDDAVFAIVPYSRSHFKEKLASIMPEVRSHKGPKFLFTHQGVVGALTIPRDVIIRDAHEIHDFYPEDFAMVFNGHYHKMQYLNNGKFIIVGSPIQKDFGERDHKKGVFVVDVGKSENNVVKMDMKFHEITNVPRFFKVEKIEDIPDEYDPDKDFLWVLSKEILDLDALEKTFKNIRVEYEKAEVVKLRTDISISLSIEEQLQKYMDYKLSLLKSHKFDKKKLLEMGVEIYKRSTT